MYFRPLPVMTALAMAGIAILAWLGAWQWARYDEKRAIEAGPPPAFETMTLTTVGSSAVSVYGVYRGQAVWRRYVPVTVGTGLVAGMALADMVVSVAQPDGSIFALPEELAGDFIALPPVGLRGAFTGRNAPEEGRFFSVDVPVMLEALGIEGPVSELSVFEPRWVTLFDVDGRFIGDGVSEVDNPWADPALANDLPPSRHLGYALTWWGLLATLIGVYIAYHVSQGRLGLGRRKGH